MKSACWNQMTGVCCEKWMTSCKHRSIIADLRIWKTEHQSSQWSIMLAKWRTMWIVSSRRTKIQSTCKLRLSFLRAKCIWCRKYYEKRKTTGCSNSSLQILWKATLCQTSFECSSMNSSIHWKNQVLDILGVSNLIHAFHRANLILLMSQSNSGVQAC